MTKAEEFMNITITHKSCNIKTHTHTHTHTQKKK